MRAGRVLLLQKVFDAEALAVAALGAHVPAKPTVGLLWPHPQHAWQRGRNTWPVMGAAGHWLQVGG